LLGTFTNNRIDREGQILTNAAHKDFIQYLDEHPERAPSLILWHLDDTNLSNGSAKAWYYNAGFVSMIWELSEKSAEFVANFDKLFNAGMSHGFNVLRFDEAGDIEQYRTFEASILPLDKAANIYTDINFIKEQDDMTDEQMAKAMQAFGAEAALKIAKQLNEAETVANELDQQGIAKKEIKEDSAEVEEIEETAADEETTINDEAKLVEALTERDNRVDEILASQQARIDELSDQVAELTKQLGGRKQAGATRASIANYWQSIKGQSIIGNEAAQVDGRSTLAKSKPKSNEETEHALNGIFDGSFLGGK